MDSYRDYPLSKFNKWKSLFRGDLKLLPSYLDTEELPPDWSPALPKQLLGIEIEVENIREDFVPKEIPESWISRKEDHSLRNNGYEYVTTPHEAEHTKKLLQLFFKHLYKKADFSKRTSIHVHYNVRDLTIGQLETLVTTYIALEKLLYKWVGNGRENSIFCVPIQDTYLAEYFSTCIKSSYPKINWTKYSGLNLSTIPSMGTVEFRHLFGTRDIHTILTWINFGLSIMKYAKETDPELAERRLVSLNTTSDYLSFVDDVLGDQSNSVLSSNFASLLAEGVSYCKSNMFVSPYMKELFSQSTKCELSRRLSKMSVTSDITNKLATVLP